MCEKVVQTANVVDVESTTERSEAVRGASNDTNCSERLVDLVLCSQAFPLELLQRI